MFLKAQLTEIIIGFGNGLALPSTQFTEAYLSPSFTVHSTKPFITWTNDDPVHWGIFITKSPSKSLSVS